ncbi:uncharacterized protein Gasu_46770 [Galdieria sulphuraria]|uniref:Uncharacterized protein n=1 Tax=Galdieria sulphuraria TaxID=130081 RepID=M2XW78_GALSU|nr:uncharacterized protein Gasu_46770 [Galdieria sulphuraria]EME27858.1 hypothetical protein Gasu_46770 [Galdieria sulphuraria]|eukprot:XP_005704378.1 hypothetical protein Gasu_46770 [Galdieria sulphuraria]
MNRKMASGGFSVAFISVEDENCGRSNEDTEIDPVQPLLDWNCVIWFPFSSASATKEEEEKEKVHEDIGFIV